MIVAALAVLGGALLTGALNVAGLRVGATPGELVLWGAAGVLFARVFALGPLVLAVPVLLAGIELAAGGGGAAGAAGGGDPFTLALPGERALAIVPVVAAAAFAAWAERFALRPRVVRVLLLATLAVSAAVDLPTVALLAVALLVPNLDRLGPLLHLPPPPVP